MTTTDWPFFYGWIVVSLFTGLVSFFSCSRVSYFATKLGMIVPPGDRQNHEIATPTGAGLGLVIAIVLTSLCVHVVIPIPSFWWINVLPGILLLTIVGWLDDKRSVSSVIRLLVQLVVSLWLLGFVWSQFSLREVGWFVSTIIAMVWLMNLYNFMDGSNGMAGFQGVFAGLVMAAFFQADEQYAMGLIALSIAAACAGFLPLNFPNARAFMGDAASVPLGFIFASLAVYGIQAGSLSLPLSVLVMSVFIVDATLTLFARVLRGEQWYTAHTEHVYQRLIIRGWSHRKVLVVYQAINVILVLPAIVLVKVYPQYADVVVGLLLILLGTCWYIVNRRFGMPVTVELK